MQSVARDYWSAWKQFVLQGVMQEDVLPPALMLSWRRCAALGLDPYIDSIQDEERSPAPGSDSQKLLSLVRPIMEDLHQFIEGSDCVVIFADADARVLDCFGDRAMQVELEHLGLKSGASWHESRQGSNALALALQESFPIQLDGALHPLYTAAAPVHDLMGSAVGVLGVIGRHEQGHPHTLGMITSAAQAVSN